MKLANTLVVLTMTLLLTACANGPRKVSVAEAAATENQIYTALKSMPTPSQPEKLYTQPVNKTEPCKLPTTKDQLERNNFRAYWDGGCKNGYANGLGRDIALSDTHHMEEITIHNGNGDNDRQPTRFINYVKAISGYGVVGTASYGNILKEIITNNGAEISIQYRLESMDNNRNYRGLLWSPFDPKKTTVSQSYGKPIFALEDFSALPSTSNQAQIVLFTADPVTHQPVGFRIVRFRNGVIQHQKLAADGQSVVELVELPPEYIAKMTEAIGEAQASVQKASADAAKAQQMEREYLHMACAADYSIKGVPPKDMKIARQICTWRDQWKEPYAKAEAKYKVELEQRQQAVARAEQQQAYIAAQQAQVAAARAAANQAEWASINNSLQSTTNQLLQFNQQLQNQNNQIMNSWAPQRSNTTVCNYVGSQFICRDR